MLKAYLIVVFAALPALAGEIRLPLAPDQAGVRSAWTLEDKQNGFSVVVPGGWLRKTGVTVPGTALTVQSSEKSRLANCNVRTTFNDGLLGISSIEYFKRAFPADDPSELIAIYRATNLNPTMLRSGRIAISETQGMFVEFDLYQGETKFRAFIVQFLKYGRLYTLGCTDTPADYVTSSPEFRLFIASFRAIGK